MWCRVQTERGGFDARKAGHERCTRRERGGGGGASVSAVVEAVREVTWGEVAVLITRDSAHSIDRYLAVVHHLGDALAQHGSLGGIAQVHCIAEPWGAWGAWGAWGERGAVQSTDREGQRGGFVCTTGGP